MITALGILLALVQSTLGWMFFHHKMYLPAMFCFTMVLFMSMAIGHRLGF